MNCPDFESCGQQRPWPLGLAIRSRLSFLGHAAHAAIQGQPCTWSTPTHTQPPQRVRSEDGRSRYKSARIFRGSHRRQTQYCGNNGGLAGSDESARLITILLSPSGVIRPGHSLRSKNVGGLSRRPGGSNLCNAALASLSTGDYTSKCIAMALPDQSATGSYADRTASSSLHLGCPLTSPGTGR